MGTFIEAEEESKRARMELAKSIDRMTRTHNDLVNHMLDEIRVLEGTLSQSEATTSQLQTENEMLNELLAQTKAELVAQKTPTPSRKSRKGP